MCFELSEHHNQACDADLYFKSPAIVRLCIALPKKKKSNPKDIRHSEKLTLNCYSCSISDLKKPEKLIYGIHLRSTQTGCKAPGTGRTQTEMHLWPDLYKHVKKWHLVCSYPQQITEKGFQDQQLRENQQTAFQNCFIFTKSNYSFSKSSF